MPSYPKPKSDKQIIVQAKTEDEKTLIRGFKEVCLLDGLEVKTEILKLIKPFLQRHNWPPGNPQITLNVQTKVTQNCQYPNCPELATHECIPESKLADPVVFYCRKHFENAEENRLLKSYKPL